MLYGILYCTILTVIEKRARVNGGRGRIPQVAFVYVIVCVCVCVYTVILRLFLDAQRYLGTWAAQYSNLTINSLVKRIS